MGGNPKYLYMGTMLRMMNDISLQRVENRRQEDSGQLFLSCWKKKKNSVNPKFHIQWKNRTTKRLHHQQTWTKGNVKGSTSLSEIIIYRKSDLGEGLKSIRNDEYG